LRRFCPENLLISRKAAKAQSEKEAKDRRADSSPMTQMTQIERMDADKIRKNP